MSIFQFIARFAADQRGAITVDWTVMSAAAVGLAIATSAIMTDSIDVLSGRMDDELRTRTLGDEWVQFAANHFEPILQTGYITEAEAQEAYDNAEDQMNYDILSGLEQGIAALEDGTITADEMVTLVGIASVAYQRNLVDDAMLDYYFGFEGGDPYYLTVANATQTGSS